MTVGNRVRKKRTELGISQKELADKLNIKKQTMNKYEMDVITNIPSDKIEQMAKILECSPAYLMGWEQENEIQETITFHLSDLEKDIIRKFRLLNDSERDMFLRMLDIKGKRKADSKMA